MSNEDAFKNDDVDFDKVQRRRQQYLARKAAERGEPLLSGMDYDGKDDDKPQREASQPQGRFAGLGKMLANRMGSNQAATGDQNSSSHGIAERTKRTITRGAAKSGENLAAMAASIQKEAQNAATAAEAALAQQRRDKENGVVGVFGGRKVVRWPFDDYHEVQKKYYLKLDEMEEAEKKSGEEGSEQPEANEKSQNRGFFGFGRGDSSQSKGSKNKIQPSNLQRPDDPPDIPTAVQGLPLNEFERKAEERAIGIVSTWLFDCGLIDELLVHGGMGKSTMRAATRYTEGSKAGDESVSSAGTQKTGTTNQGIEVGAFGHVIEGPSKMDKEIAKLRGGTQRQLTMVNSRLNDGVAASGGEVQELVNAVNGTKDDLGRLRELSTYIGGLAGSSAVPNDGNTVGGDEISMGSSKVQNNMMARSQTFMLTNYPKLKKAINARRNLARCFRELDFYSQIPLTCERLREDLHSAEWTDHEWSSLREVSREHVELEIFLVEAESGMKKRIEEEIREGQQRSGEPDEHDTSRLAHLTRAEQRNSASGNGLSIGSTRLSKLQNYEEVDNFLHEHVKNVWELGDEIRMRIMSGIGGAFELATNNPAGLVALVEAVESYEQANEEYKTVHGEEAGGKLTGNEKPQSYRTNNKGAQNLRFTDMRASALKQMYQDFELRGLEVFREVHEVVRKLIRDAVHCPHFLMDCSIDSFSTTGRIAHKVSFRFFLFFSLVHFQFTLAIMPMDLL